jgi:2-polyprenyl-3-methyl-5-hydroxy-6-metoxy-1,4-benzoquinol methylase
MTKVVATPIRSNEGTRVQEARACLLCGSEGTLLYPDIRDRLFGVPGIWALARCPKCHLIWLNPRPVDEDIAKLYAGYATHDTPSGKPGRFARFWKTAKISLMASALGYRANGTNPGLGRLLSAVGPFREVGAGAGMWLEASSRGRLLDVGCGAGAFLAQMAQFGWEVTGVEPDEEAVKVARQNLGLNVYQGSLQGAGFPADSFDAVTVHHVIEHVLDPIGLLKACWHVLKPGGRLVVVTPNIESLAHRWLRVSWLHLDPPRHLLLFSQETLRESAVRAGLRIKDVRTTARNAGGTWYMSRLLKRHGMLPGLTMSPQNPSLGLLLGGFAFWMLEHLLVKTRPCGEELVMICNK